MRVYRTMKKMIVYPPIRKYHFTSRRYGSRIKSPGFCRRDFCPGGFFPGGFLWLDFFRGDFIRLPGDIPGMDTYTTSKKNDWSGHTGNIILHLGDRTELDIFHLHFFWQYRFHFYRKRKKKCNDKFRKKNCQNIIFFPWRHIRIDIYIHTWGRIVRIKCGRIVGKDKGDNTKRLKEILSLGKGRTAFGTFLCLYVYITFQIFVKIEQINSRLSTMQPIHKNSFYIMVRTRSERSHHCSENFCKF